MQQENAVTVERVLAGAMALLAVAALACWWHSLHVGYTLTIENPYPRALRVTRCNCIPLNPECAGRGEGESEYSVRPYRTKAIPLSRDGRGSLILHPAGSGKGSGETTLTLSFPEDIARSVSGPVGPVRVIPGPERLWYARSDADSGPDTPLWLRLLIAAGLLGWVRFLLENIRACRQV